MSEVITTERLVEFAMGLLKKAAKTTGEPIAAVIRRAKTQAYVFGQMCLQFPSEPESLLREALAVLKQRVADDPASRFAPERQIRAPKKGREPVDDPAWLPRVAQLLTIMNGPMMSSDELLPKAKREFGWDNNFYAGVVTVAEERGVLEYRDPFWLMCPWIEEGRERKMERSERLEIAKTKRWLPVEYEYVDVEERLDRETGVVYTVRLDTRAVIETRPVPEKHESWNKGNRTAFLKWLELHLREEDSDAITREPPAPKHEPESEVLVRPEATEPEGKSEPATAEAAEPKPNEPDPELSPESESEAQGEPEPEKRKTAGELGYSATKIAKLVGCSHSSVAHYFQGVARGLLAEKIAKVLTEQPDEVRISPLRHTAMAHGLSTGAIAKLAGVGTHSVTRFFRGTLGPGAAREAIQKAIDEDSGSLTFHHAGGFKPRWGPPDANAPEAARDVEPETPIQEPSVAEAIESLEAQIKALKARFK